MYLRYDINMELVFKDLDLSVKDKVILSNVYGFVKKGELLTMMGPSGAGKTTLLNILAGRCTYHRGSVTLNGIPFNKQLKRKIAYVPQKDVFFPKLTLRETLMYTAMLILPEKMPYNVKLKRINETLDVLDLSHCSENIMGDEIISGIGLSGGERKRASIACRLVSNPVVLLLDEPTSGLDSTTAYRLMKTMKKYAEEMNKTVLVSIHQPSSRIFDLFGRLLLLVEGKVGYFGAANEVITFFSEIGMSYSIQFNPADFILDMVKQDDESVQLITNHADACMKFSNFECFQKEGSNMLALKVDTNEAVRLTDAYNPSTIIDSDLEMFHYMDRNLKWPTGYWTQFSTLTRRSFKQSIHRLAEKTNYISAIMYTLMIIVLWFQVGHTENDIQNINGMFFFCITESTFYISFAGILTFQRYRPVIERERQESTYRLSALFFSSLISEILVDVFYRFLLYSVVYWVVGLTAKWWLFLSSLGVYMLGIFVSHSIGMVIGVLLKDIDTAVTIVLAIMVYNFGACDLLVRNLPVNMKWIQYTTFLKYLLGGLLKLEFTYGLPIYCNNNTLTHVSNFEECFLKDSNSTIPSDSILSLLNHTSPLWLDIVVLVCTFIICLIATYFALKYFDKPRKIKMKK